MLKVSHFPKVCLALFKFRRQLCEEDVGRMGRRGVVGPKRSRRLSAAEGRWTGVGGGGAVGAGLT